VDRIQTEFWAKPIVIYGPNLRDFYDLGEDHNEVLLAYYGGVDLNFLVM
jgi:hypothetical protein